MHDHRRWIAPLRTVALIALALVGTAGIASAQAPAAPGAVTVYRGTATLPAVTVTVSPAPASVAPGASLQFSSAVSGSPNTTVVWSATGGTISPTGLYTAGMTTGTYSVRATLSGGTIYGAAAVSVAIQPSSTVASTSVSPGQNIQAVVDATPENTTILLKSGVHRMQTIVPKNGQVFVGEVGTVLSGARLLTSFSREGTAWVATGQTQQGTGGGECWASSPRCANPEDLFIDDIELHHVASLSAGGPGRWFFDYANDKIYFWDDPTGHRVETSVTPAAFGGGAAFVSIRDLVIEKFASPAQMGVIRGGDSWTIENCEVRFNHGIGIDMAAARHVVGNKVHHNGQMGIGGSSSDGLVENNEIAYNNQAGYNAYWEAGGTKFTYSTNLVVRGNFVHHNDGPGLWTDIDNIGVLMENNRVEDNALSGIFHEISYQAVIRNNIVKRNGQQPPIDYYVDGAGILISTSSDVEVYGNDLEDNWQGITALDQPRGSGVYGVRILKNLYVHDNIVRATTARLGTGRTGLDGGSNDATYSSQNNHFEHNTYYMGTNDTLFFWRGTNLTPTGWTSAGQDATGSFLR